MWVQTQRAGVRFGFRTVYCVASSRCLGGLHVAAQAAKLWRPLRLFRVYNATAESTTLPPTPWLLNWSAGKLTKMILGRDVALFNETCLGWHTEPSVGR